MGRLPAHSDHRWDQNEAELARKTMALRQSLNGEWQFAHSPNPAARPADFWKEEADRSAFGRIQVPAPDRLERRARLWRASRSASVWKGWSRRSICG